MAIFDLHHPWAFTFGILGNIISIFVYFAPLPTFIRIYKEKSTLGFQSVPYVVALFSAMLWMYYAFLKVNALLLISINSFGCIIETIYIFVYLLYASKKARNDTGKMLAALNLGLFSLIFLLTFFPFKGSARVVVVGWISVAVSTCVFAAPLSIVFQVIRTKSVEFMPFTLSFFLTLSAIMWFGYGLFQKDFCVALPNVVGFFLGMLQMLLYAIYRNPKKEEVVAEEKKLPEHVINIVTLETSDDVHPVDSKKVGDDEVEVGAEAEKKDDDEEEDDDKIENGLNFGADGEPDQPSQDCKANVQIDHPPVLVVCAA